MTPTERRELRRNIADMRAQSLYHHHQWFRAEGRRVLAMLEAVEEMDPRPSWWLRVRLRLRGVRAG